MYKNQMSKYVDFLFPKWNNVLDIRLTYIVYLHVSLWDQHVDSSLLCDRENSLESDSLFDIHVVNFHYFRHLQLLMTYFISAGVFDSIFNTVKTV